VTQLLPTPNKLVGFILAGMLILFGGDAFAQVFSVLAGTGSSGFSGDGGPAISAQLNVPSSIFVDVDGNITIADTSNDRGRRISPGGTISTLAGTGDHASSGDGGDADLAGLGTPTAIFVDGRGNTYIAEYTGHRVRKVSPTGEIETIAGVGLHGFQGDGGPATESNIWSPSAIFIDRTGSLFISEWGNNRIRKVSPEGIISSVAGTGIRGYTGDGGPATAARITNPNGIFVDGEGIVYFSDLGNSVIRRVLANGRIEKVVGIPGVSGFTGDGGPATDARIQSPSGLFADGGGNLYFVDSGNSRIRRVTPDGMIETVAGGNSSEPDFPTDARQLSLGGPTSIFIDRLGDLYVAEGSRHRVRRLSGIEEPTDLPGAQPATSDFDSDGIVGFKDFLFFVEQFGKQTTDLGFDTRVDLLEDGQIDFIDFLRFARAYGNRG
jgi:hypothetical protein